MSNEFARALRHAKRTSPAEELPMVFCYQSPVVWQQWAVGILVTILVITAYLSPMLLVVLLFLSMLLLAAFFWMIPVNRKAWYWVLDPNRLTFTNPEGESTQFAWADMVKLELPSETETGCYRLTFAPTGTVLELPVVAMKHGWALLPEKNAEIAAKIRRESETLRKDRLWNLVNILNLLNLISGNSSATFSRSSHSSMTPAQRLLLPIILIQSLAIMGQFLLPKWPVLPLFAFALLALYYGVSSLSSRFQNDLLVPKLPYLNVLFMLPAISTITTWFNPSLNDGILPQSHPQPIAWFLAIVFALLLSTLDLIRTFGRFLTFQSIRPADVTAWFNQIKDYRKRHPNTVLQ